MREIKFRAWDKEANKWISEPMMFYMQNHEPFASTLHIHENLGTALMQYTGLKDKNGVEIYEGDIIGDGLFVREVNFGLTGFRAGEDDLYDYADEPYEVIGNIYENPELLK